MAATMKEYRFLKDVPKKFKTIVQWKKKGRQVSQDRIEFPQGILNSSRNKSNNCQPTFLYHSNQTIPIQLIDINALPNFRYWKDVPNYLKTKSQWLKEGRQVSLICNTSPQAMKIWNKLVFREKSKIEIKNDEKKKDDIKEEEVIYEFQGKQHLLTMNKIVTDSCFLYHRDQTIKFIPPPQKNALESYCSIYFDLANKNTFRKEKGKGLWIANKNNGKGFWNKFHKKMIVEHLNFKKTYAINGGLLTRFLIIDHDLHEYNRQIFLAQTKILLKYLYGFSTWHIQFDRHDFNGTQFIVVFKNPVNLEEYRNKISEKFKLLDLKHPKLKKQAINAGMKSFSELEIYPDPNHSIRLPLGKNRSIFTDKPLEGYKDLENYIQWINDPNKKYMSRKIILDQIEIGIEMSKGIEQKPSVKNKKIRPATPNLKNGASTKLSLSNDSNWKGNGIKFLLDYWLHNNPNGKNFNEHLLWLARLAYCFDCDQKETLEAIFGFACALKEPAISACSRLRSNNYKKIKQDIRSTIKSVFTGKGRLEAAYGLIDNHPAFNPLDKSTWDSLTEVKRFEIKPVWKAEDLKIIVKNLNKVLYDQRKPITSNQYKRTKLFLNKIIALAHYKEKYNQGFKYDYFMRWIQSSFNSIKVLNRGKVLKIFNVLENNQILVEKYKGIKGLFATKWKLGIKALAATGYIK